MDFPSQVGYEPPESIDLSDQALQLLFASWGVGSRLVAAYLDSWGRGPRGMFDYLKRIWVLLRVQPCQYSQKPDQLGLNRQALSQSELHCVK